MDDQNHTELLRLQSVELTGSTPFCPDDQVIAEYFDGGVAEAERKSLERHLTDCGFCHARVGILERLESIRANKRIPEAVMAAAKLMSYTAPVRQSRMAPAWAAAAVLVIALFTIVNRSQEPVLDPGATPSAVPSSEEFSEQLRSVNRDSADLIVLVPKPGANMIPGSLIQWAELPGSLHYEIFVLSYAGDVLWTERVADPEWVLLESLKLSEDSTYYLRVDARLRDGRSVRSKHVAFRLAERQ